MTISIYILFYILVIHWVCDFILQTDYMAINKSKSWKALLLHTCTYSIFMGCGMGVFLHSKEMVLFTGITLLAHTVTDAITSRISAMFWKQEKRWLFFVTIGADQILHYIQLILTYVLLNR
jgi:hypothetical protein